MRKLLVATAVDLSTSASTAPVNLQSSRVNPPIFLNSVNDLVDGTNASPCVFTADTVGLSDGTAVVLGGSPPTGFTAGTTYYTVSSAPGSKTFELAATVGGAAINSTGSASDVPMFAPNANLTGNRSGHYDEAGIAGFAFTPGNTVVLSILSLATQSGTVVSVETADEDATAGTPGTYASVASTTGSAGLELLFNIVLKQFIRVTVTTATSETGTAEINLLAS